jgi:A/G-specific adenine glycosylase
MSANEKKVTEFQRMIFSWWESHRRDLPWRKTHDPYRILISEVMLQQTQVSRVLPKYEEFLTLFPDVQVLAGATVASVLRAWKGMGYNRRALYLHKTAQVVMSEHKGVFPMIESELLKLPGLGIYTVRALLVFAYKKDVAMVDTNVRQIITHYFFSGEKQSATVVQKIADSLVPKGLSWEWHQALMDYGALAMSRIKPKSPQSRKKAIPFRESNRFYRGRIMDLLRENTREENELVYEIATRYNKSEDLVEVILEGLVSEGLVVKKSTKISLPE